jgi:hypothetical protein
MSLAAGVEAGHELAVGAAGGGQVLITFGQAGPELLIVLGELGDLLFELAGVVGLAEPGLPPGLLAEGPGQAVFELADAGGQPGGALTGGQQAGLQRGPGNGRPASRLGGWLGLAGVDLLKQVAVPVEEGAVHPGLPGDRGHADLLTGRGGGVECLEDALAAAGRVGASP